MITGKLGHCRHVTEAKGEVTDQTGYSIAKNTGVQFPPNLGKDFVVLAEATSFDYTVPQRCVKIFSIAS